MWPCTTPSIRWALTLSQLRTAYSRAGGAVEIGVRDREEQPFGPILERFLTAAKN
jgi:hypothetical protein